MKLIKQNITINTNGKIIPNGEYEFIVKTYLFNVLIFTKKAVITLTNQII